MNIFSPFLIDTKMEEFNSYLNSIRRDFAGKPLNESAVPENPYALFEQWFDEAVGTQVFDPYAMTLSTANKEGRPSSRTLYMRGVSASGLVFYTNYNSQKGKEMAENEWVSALFHWGPLERQIRIEGRVKKTTAEVSDAYFASRPRESQIGAWASTQSSTLNGREALEEAIACYTQQFEGKEVPRPPHWGGYEISPVAFEFWQGRASRLHDRIVYSLHDGQWQISRKSP